LILPNKISPSCSTGVLKKKKLGTLIQAFEEAELAKQKEEKPGLTLHQYKEMIWKLWKKSPDNPLNQVAD